MYFEALSYSSAPNLRCCLGTFAKSLGVCGICRHAGPFLGSPDYLGLCSLSYPTAAFVGVAFGASMFEVVILQP